MNHHDDGGEEVGAEKSSFLRRNRGLTMAGIAGLAVVSGVGAFLVNQGRDGTPSEVTAIAPVTTLSETAVPASAAGTSEPSAAATTSSPPSTAATTASPAASSRPAPPAATTTDSRAGQQRVKAARDEAAKDGIPLKRPLAASTVAPRDLSSLAEETRPLPGGGTMRIITGRFDLSGRREMAWAGDDGKEVGGARCTQNFNFSANSKPAIRPTMLLCWRTSEKKSVVVLAVKQSGQPSMTESAAVVGESWKKLG